ncbi:hypothetical protein BT63DRAFT_476277 [Microthyrium microscopicum]|uniref:Thymidylate kinase n=1 Tax=Microthyrium microscopicum TaxID=703497 RepID=A0A6A6UNF8_9PEZI|nr:hypothetical protein BT63DRAFT_476277 [Microthyrium microscopicum]
MALLTPRQPFAVLDESRLQSLSSTKNRQNNISNQLQSFKAPASAPAKRRLASDLLSDEFDLENMDPNILSPKRSKNLDGGHIKVSKFILKDATPKTAPALNPSSKRKAESYSVPTSTASSPLFATRGSTQNKRISLLSGKRRSLTPYRRLDPPNKGSALPFSIDAALSGTISSYTPPAATTLASPPSPEVPITSLFTKKQKTAPSTWFFEIHEDTPEQEATNLMEHSASVLDISSDDDSGSARAKDLLERGKENVPPPEWTGPTTRVRASERVAHKGISCPVKAAKYAAMHGPDAMVEDRLALREMDVAAFFAEDVDENEATEPVEEEGSQQRPRADSLEVAKDVVQLLANPSVAPSTDGPQAAPFVIREDTPEAAAAASTSATEPATI